MHGETEQTGRGTYSINIGVRVLGLAVLGQDARSDLVNLADQLEHGVIRQLAESKLALGRVARVGLAKNGVTVSRNNATSVEGRPEIVLDGLVAEVVADDLLHFGEPVKDFLVGPIEKKHIRHIETWQYQAFIGKYEAYNPWRGPARPLRPAARESMGELRALPTRWVV